MNSDVGIIGAGTIGGNLALNIADNDHTVAIFDIDKAKVQNSIEHQSMIELGRVTSPKLKMTK